MNEFLEIFSDVVLVATFQPRSYERRQSQRQFDEFGLHRHRANTASPERRFDALRRI